MYKKKIIMEPRLSHPCLLLALFVLVLGSTTIDLRAADKPNIIILLTDDQGWGMTGLNSDGAIKTPHLDKMAQAGIHFSQFYAAYPNCAPTRASLLTGRHPLRMGINSIGKKLPTEEVTIAHVLSQAGYRTGQFGKWHFQGPAKDRSKQPPAGLSKKNTTFGSH